MITRPVEIPPAHSEVTDLWGGAEWLIPAALHTLITGKKKRFVGEE